MNEMMPERSNRRGKSGETRDNSSQRRARTNIQPDELDLQIIALLRADGRRSNREVARRLGVPEATVRYRVRRLTESGVLKIAASVDPEHLGYALTSVISVQVEPRLFVEAADEIARMPEVMWLAITSGASDIILTASFHNQDEMFSFVADRLAHVEGVSRIETSVCMRVVKKSHQWSTDLTTSYAPDIDAAQSGDFAADETEEGPAPRRRRAVATARR